MKKSFRNKLIMFLVTEVLLVLTLLGWASLAWTRSIIEEKVSDSTVMTLSLMDRNIAAMFDGIHDISLFLISNRNVRQLLKTADFQSPQTIQLRADINDDLANLVPARSWILSINFYGENGMNYESSGPSLSVSPMAATPAPPADGTLFMSAGYARNYQTLGTRQVISFYRQINDTNDFTRRLGTLRIDLDVAALVAVTRMNPELGSMVFMTDPYGRILIHPDSTRQKTDLSADAVFGPALSGASAYYRVHLNGIDSLVTRYRSARGVLVSVRPFQELVKDAGKTEWFFGGLFLGSALITILVAWRIARHLTTPLLSLVQGMRKLQAGTLGVTVAVANDVDLGELGRTFNAMSVHLQELVDTVYKTEIAKKAAELKALQAQINPHFLYNTLDVIYWTARMEGSLRAAEATNALSRLFRLVLNKGEEMTTLEHELDHLELYMQIQSLRFETPPCLEIKVAPAALACVTPKLLLQPLVENACLHGIADLDLQAHIVIRGDIVDDQLQLSVEDNGVGMTVERWREVIGRDMSATNSYGLWNIQEAIRLYYGPGYPLEMDSLGGKGTRIRVSLPARTAASFGEFR